MPTTCRRTRHGWRALWLGLALLGQAGCGSKGLYPVSGRLEYEDGQPLTDLAGYMVLFDSEALNRSARGEIQPDATFRLANGAAPGLYKVTVTQPTKRPERAGGGDPVVDPIYENPTTTPLTANVEPKGDNHFTFQLKRMQPKRR
jgi:hypothetical protein